MSSASLSPKQVHDSLGDEMCHTEADHRHPRRPPQLLFQPQHHKCIFTFFARFSAARTLLLEQLALLQEHRILAVALSGAEGGTHYSRNAFPGLPFVF
jgi:hypothetical protein